MSTSPLTPLPALSLILGGARSGKSRHAEQLVESAGGDCLYIATAVGQAERDAEMAARIADHKARRGERWQTIEEPLDLAGVLIREARAERPILVDCLTLWLSNLMAGERDIEAEIDTLVSALYEAGTGPKLAGPVVFVSNEVGHGIVPMHPLARDFRDHAGRLHQAVAAVADSVVFMVAGIPMTVKAP
ncbi:bifunctional adenosylcobinamide kinase/adenosylcobinamide-phosphate guanylyltransferase [Denitrobaculum tricleocarpae]|uniref:Bifunctional adenosylcobalamin biosynthesis protein n=1 Tax=Denitrobaculum tricleocarpae TaxID=2591009 RepID=A0A545TKW8_9PROT|nr:bifunctional adenosylcobinamide kinase/adenosylcobinamide-phosphate guanylyltransferase [Denitrobaculum tricleocarpae]TQV77869.1 bifunctional adenosylcobinamide kinase/adenosylcobinamide-phosphate guanylyltransferase [Denitrobaculum tricleocarpae]